MQCLARRIGFPIERLKAIADNIRQARRSHYRHFALETGKGEVRHIDHPAPELLYEWTTVQPVEKEKHFIVTGLVQPEGGSDAPPLPNH